MPPCVTCCVSGWCQLALLYQVYVVLVVFCAFVDKFWLICGTLRAERAKAMLFTFSPRVPCDYCRASLVLIFSFSAMAARFLFVFLLRRHVCIFSLLIAVYEKTSVLSRGLFFSFLFYVVVYVVVIFLLTVSLSTSFGFISGFFSKSFLYSSIIFDL